MTDDRLQQIMQTIYRKLRPYKWSALVLLLGVGLMLLPSGKKEPTPQETPVSEEDPTDLEEELTAILSEIEGVGTVHVMLSKEQGSVYIYQTNEVSNSSEDRSEIRSDTVLVSNDSGGEAPVPVNTIYPTYKGALVVCQGADRPSVKLAVIDAVSNLTGLRSDCISVIKMKAN